MQYSDSDNGSDDEENRQQSAQEIRLRDCYERSVVVRDTGLPIVIEDILELATRIRFKSIPENSTLFTQHIVFGGMEGLRPILANDISEPLAAAWVASFMNNPLVVARLATHYFDQWEFEIDDIDSSVRALVTPVSLKTEASWKLFGSPHAAFDNLRNEYYTICDPLPASHGTATTVITSLLAVHDDCLTTAPPASMVTNSSFGSLPTATESSSSQMISDESIRMLGLRAGCVPLSVEAANVVREKINEFISSILVESVGAVDVSPTLGAGPGLMLSRSVDDSLDRAGCSVAGLGYKGYVYTFLCVVLWNQ